MAREHLSPVGQWLGQSFSGLKTRLLPLSIILVVGFVGVVAGMLLVYAIGAVLFGFIQGWGLVVETVTNPQRLQAFVAQNQLVILVFELLAALVGLRIYCWATLAAIHAASFDSTGVRAAFRAGKGRGYGFLGLFIILQVLIGIGAVFFSYRVSSSRYSSVFRFGCMRWRTRACSLPSESARDSLKAGFWGCSAECSWSG